MACGIGFLQESNFLLNYRPGANRRERRTSGIADAGMMIVIVDGTPLNSGSVIARQWVQESSRLFV
jgi:hypothetical protein